MSDPAHILIVDDQEEVREITRRMIAELGHRVTFADNGLSALARIRREPPDLILLDVEMPEMNGLDTLQKLKADVTTRDIPVLMISGVGADTTILRCLELGSDDYLKKPCDFQVLKARIESGLRKKRLRDQELEYRDIIEQYNLNLEERVRKEVAKNVKSHLATIFAMSKLAESRDPETGEHLERIQQYCKAICSELSKLPEFESSITPAFVENIVAASPLHDIGKVGISDVILLKPGKLTKEEFEVMKTHAQIGADTLRAVDESYGSNEFVALGIDIAESHHEKWNGSGYPKGLSGDDIPLPGRILAVPDVYDALTSKRCYKEAFNHKTSRDIIRKDSGKHFDPRVVDAFVAAESEFMRIRREHADK